MGDQSVGSDDELISIPLHQKHWVVLLGSLENTVEQTRARITELRSQGIDHTTLPDPLVTALAAPTIVRGIIVKELAARGIMKPGADANMGVDRIMDEIRKFRRDL
ncbi:MAG TPA: hypothetical protein VHD56_02145 [Tepidisphaeraceae bacterium]|nr:hypothetical protein [Tepidisphaeraceae bacterium]